MIKKIIIIKFLLIFIGVATVYRWAYKLQSHYPSYNKNTNQYELLESRPKNWVELRNISKYAKWAIIVSEDWAFYDHQGVDFNQVMIVIKESLKERRLVRGASTITQQVVKNALLNNEKSLTRKIKEVILSLIIEQVMSKDQILEKYLNLIELDRNVYGIGEASLHYFDKTAAEIELKEACFLAMLLPSPRRYSESFHKKELTEFASEQVQKILIKLRQAKIITEKKRLEIKDDKLSFEKSLLEEFFEEVGF